MDGSITRPPPRRALHLGTIVCRLTPAEMERRVNDCIRPIIKCGANGHP